MTNCNSESMLFSPLSGKKVTANFNGGSITSNGGALLLREMDKQIKLSQQLTGCLSDARLSRQVKHSMRSMLSQRIYGIACGYEDLNDQDTLRHDACLQTAVNSHSELASSPTLSRMENSFTHADCVNASKLLVELFIQKHKKAPKEIILDFDATDDPIHGNQEGKHFNGYYDCHCYMPLHVFCGDDLLVSYLRPSNIDGAKHAWAILALLVKRLRQVWSNTKIIFRGDAGFCRNLMLLWCQKNDVDYITGMPSNNRLRKVVVKDVEQARQEFEVTGEDQRKFVRFEYAAKSWKAKRNMVARIEYTHHGESVRFVTTNINGHGRRLYDKLYCFRGDMENKIKQLKLDMFSGRTSCKHFVANQMRLLLSSFAYVLIQAIQDGPLKLTKLAKAYSRTIRLKFVKIGGVVLRNTRTVKLLLDSCYPEQQLFKSVVQKIVPT